VALANFMLGGGFLNSRLATRLRQQEGISYFAGSQLQVASLDRAGTLYSIAILNPVNVDRLVSGLWDELNKVRTTGFTAAEVARPSRASSSSDSSRGPTTGAGGHPRRTPLRRRTMDYDTKYEAAVNALTADQVNTVIRKYIDPSKISIVARRFKNKPR